MTLLRCMGACDLASLASARTPAASTIPFFVYSKFNIVESPVVHAWYSTCLFTTTNSSQQTSCNSICAFSYIETSLIPDHSNLQRQKLINKSTRFFSDCLGLWTQVCLCHTAQTLLMWDTTAPTTVAKPPIIGMVKTLATPHAT